METVKRLQSNRDALLEQYHANLEDVYGLQDTLIQSILPSVTDELGLGKDAQEWAKEWLSDTSTIFRMSRRNKFTRSFSLEAAQKNLLWRLENLWPLQPPLRISNLHCLPANVRDPFGRPILILEMAPVADLSVQKAVIVRAFERLRLHLKQVYDGSADDSPTLQYTVLVDLGQLSLKSMNLDLFAWVAKEVIPKFPGMIAAVFMLNYSWAHSGLWTVIKRLLPESALSRVFFPSRTELIEIMTRSALPEELGGSLPSLTYVEDPLRSRSEPSLPVVQPCLPGTSPTNDSPTPPRVASWLTATSAFNPFFGYPVATTSPGSMPALQHGRRRKRDLLRTLAKLFWLRWHNHITAGFCIVVLFAVLKFSLRKGRRGTAVAQWLLFNRRSTAVP